MSLPNKYKMILAYDGSNYCGWQKQHASPSIEGTLKKSFSKTFGTPLFCVASSRTDSGVHALGQVVLCKFDFDLPATRIAKIWNDALPSDILIRSLEAVTDQFHPWYNIERKEYYYHVVTAHALPFLSGYAYYYRAPFDHEKMKLALQLFVGTHDFTAFAHADERRENMVRTVDAIEAVYLKRFGVWQLRIVGKKFMRHMIRKMVGAAIYVASDVRRSPLLIADALRAKKRVHELPTAPAHGLLLRKVVYKDCARKEPSS
jgi:tRNA pseudouridine38-40 synthase